MPTNSDSAATTESREDRDERWRDWMERSMQFCPLNLYDETRKLGEYAFSEMLTLIHELEAESHSAMPDRQEARSAAQDREVYAFVWSFLICYAAGLLGAFGWGRHWNAYLCLLLTLGSVVLWATFVTAWRNRLGR